MDPETTLKITQTLQQWAAQNAEQLQQGVQQQLQQHAQHTKENIDQHLQQIQTSLQQRMDTHERQLQENFDKLQSQQATSTEQQTRMLQLLAQQKHHAPDTHVATTAQAGTLQGSAAEGGVREVAESQGITMAGQTRLLKELFQQVEQKVSAAEERAASADARAAAAESQATRAAEKAASAEVRAACAEAQTKEAEERTAAADLRALEAEAQTAAAQARAAAETLQAESSAKEVAAAAQQAVAAVSRAETAEAAAADAEKKAAAAEERALAAEGRAVAAEERAAEAEAAAVARAEEAAELRAELQAWQARVRTIPESKETREVTVNAATLEEGVARLVRSMHKASKAYLRFQDNEAVAWTADAGATVAGALLINRALDKFQLDFPSTAEPDGIEHLINAVSRHPGLTSVDLVNLFFEGVSPDWCLRVLRSNQNLTHFSADGADMGDTVLGRLLILASGNSLLRSLDLSHNNLTPYGASLIAEFLRSNETLTALDIFENPILDEGMLDLLDALHANTTLTCLRLGRHECTRVGRQRALELMESDRLTTLRVAESDYDDEEFQQVLTAFGRTSSITDLDLSLCQWSESQSELLLKALRGNQTLQCFGMWCSSVGEQGAALLVDALAAERLTTLDLFMVELGPRGGQLLSVALSTNQTLTSLDLEQNELKDAGAVQIAAALETNKALTFLKLDDNMITSHGAVALATGLTANGSLKTLSLQQNSIGEAGAHALREALEVNFSLTDLGMDHANLDPELLEQITVFTEKNAEPPWVLRLYPEATPTGLQLSLSTDGPDGAVVLDHTGNEVVLEATRTTTAAGLRCLLKERVEPPDCRLEVVLPSGALLRHIKGDVQLAVALAQ